MHDEGLIHIYISKIQTIAAKALAGEPFESPTEKVVIEAVSHIKGVKTSNPLENLQAFAGRLNLLAEITHPSQPKYQATIQYACELVRKQVASL